MPAVLRELKLNFFLTLLLTFVGFTGPAVAQDAKQSDESKPAAQEQDDENAKSLKQWIRESKKVYNEEYWPLQSEHQRATSELYTEISQHRYLISALKPTKGEPREIDAVRSEITMTQQRLDMLLKLEEVLSDMDDDAVEKAVKKAETDIKKLEDSRRELNAPFTQSISDLMRTHSKMNKGFANSIAPVLKEEAGGSFEGFKQNYLNANFASSNFNSRYVNGKKSVNISITLHNPKTSFSTDKMYKDKFPILSQSNRSIMIKVEDYRISVYSSGVTEEDGDLTEFVDSVIDVEAFAEATK